MYPARAASRLAPNLDPRLARKSSLRSSQEVVARQRYARALFITERGAGRRNDVYIIESWFGHRRNVRNVYAADADDALQTHALHYPGEYIVSVQRGDGPSV